jgi:glycosyltransferase involved in cell wall biosynthesis
MIGTGPLEEELHRLAQELGVAQRVRFTGLVKYSRLPEYYTMSDALVFCSDHEPYGLPINEAMLCGKPVIVSDRIGARLDLVDEGKTGWVYPVADIAALAQFMRQAIEDPEALRRMGLQAREKMKAWSSEVNVANQVAYFRQRGWM